MSIRLLLPGSLVLGLAVASCSEPVQETVPNGRIWQEVSEISTRPDPVIELLVLDDRPGTRLQDSPLFSEQDDKLDRSLRSVATGFELDPRGDVADLPREVALVIVLPAHGRIVGAPQVPALHVRSPSFDRVEAKRMADALRALVREVALLPVIDERLVPYAPVEAGLDARALLLGARSPRTDDERRLQADLAGLAVESHLDESDVVLVTGDFPGLARPNEGLPPHVLPTTITLGPCLDPTRCRSLSEMESIFPQGPLDLVTQLPVSRHALDADGRSRCTVEVRGYDLGCEARGWRRSKVPGGSMDRCEIPELEGEAARACREHVRCETCSPGFCGRVERSPSLGFTKNAFPNQRSATLKVTCDLVR